jgi:hypothetical protein
MQVAALKVSGVSGGGRSRKDLSKALFSVLRFLNLTGKRSRTRDFRDSFFDVMELWIENKLLIELLPPEIAPQYVAFMQPQNLEKLFFATVTAA